VPMAEIVVEDNGRGVPPAQQTDLFKRFFRGDGQTESGVDSGAGLGLAIVHDIMALHRGSVHYEDAPEGGARFIVRVPLTGRPNPTVETSSNVPAVDRHDQRAATSSKRTTNQAPVDS
jgi:signal transduction histidine kinase